MDFAISKLITSICKEISLWGKHISKKVCCFMVTCNTLHTHVVTSCMSRWILYHNCDMILCIMSLYIGIFYYYCYSCTKLRLESVGRVVQLKGCSRAAVFICYLSSKDMCVVKNTFNSFLYEDMTKN